MSPAAKRTKYADLDQYDTITARGLRLAQNCFLPRLVDALVTRYYKLIVFNSKGPEDEIDPNGRYYWFPPPSRLQRLRSDNLAQQNTPRLAFCNVETGEDVRCCSIQYSVQYSAGHL